MPKLSLLLTCQRHRFSAANLVGSKSEARQLLTDGGVYVNDQRITRDAFAWGLSRWAISPSQRGRNYKIALWF